MTTNPRGVIVFVAFCVLLMMALSDPAWTLIASAIATVLIALGVGGVLFPSLRRKIRGL